MKHHHGLPIILAATLAATLAALGTGCAATAATFENRLVVTPQCDRGFVASLYGPVGLTSEVAAADVKLLCAAREGAR